MNKLVVHCKKEPYDVYVGRPSIFGNPFTHHQISDTLAEIQVPTRRDAVLAYKNWLLGLEYTDFKQKLRKRVLEELHKLRGKVLGCWCSPLECHADVLATLSNNLPRGGEKT